MKYNGQRYPDDGPALVKLAPDDARNLRASLGDGGLFRLEEQLLRDRALKDHQS